MHLFHVVRDTVVQTLHALAQEKGLSVTSSLQAVVEPPRDEAHGDMATNAAMIHAKFFQMSPRALADELVARLQQDSRFTEVSVAGPGFINLRLDAGLWVQTVVAMLKQPDHIFKLDLGCGQAVNVEYVSANPTGPMHVGHGRGAVIGDALASLMQAAGFAVTREYYINDAGHQIDVLSQSAYLRYLEAKGEAIGSIPDGLYPGDYLMAVGEALYAEHGDRLASMPERERLAFVRDSSITLMMQSIREDLQALNVRHDVFFSERSLMAPHDRVGAVIEQLRQAGHVVEGRLPPPKGSDVTDWEDREQTIFLSMRFGDDVDRALKKSDGTYTYFASDIAYHADKAARGFPLMIDVWGADHGGYVKRMKAAVAAVTDGKASLDVELCQLVRLLRNGEPVRMSKRAGDFVTLREVIDEVGVDAVRFIMLTRKSDATLDFDLAKVLEQSKDNPVFYVQYAHSRCCSIARHAEQNLGELSIEKWIDVTDMGVLRDEGEIRILKQLCQAPRLLEQAVIAREPHRVAYYLMDVATLFHAQWNKGKDLPELRFMVAGDNELTRARLLMVAAVAAVLREGLALLGVSAPEAMHS